MILPAAIIYSQGHSTSTFGEQQNTRDTTTAWVPVEFTHMADATRFFLCARDYCGGPKKCMRVQARGHADLTSHQSAKIIATHFPVSVHMIREI